MSKGARRLLALYPRGWRDRYGDEFLALLGDGPLRVNQIISIVSGAIDARFSSDIRASINQQHGALAPQGGSSVTLLKHLCALDRKSAFTIRDGWIGAGAMVGTSVVLAFGGAFLRRQGFDEAGEFLKGLAFPASLVASNHFMFMRRQSRKAQLVITGGTLAILSATAWLAVLI